MWNLLHAYDLTLERRRLSKACQWPWPVQHETLVHFASIIWSNGDTKGFAGHEYHTCASIHNGRVWETTFFFSWPVYERQGTDGMYACVAKGLIFCFKTQIWFYVLLAFDLLWSLPWVSSQEGINKQAYGPLLVPIMHQGLTCSGHNGWIPLICLNKYYWDVIIRKGIHICSTIASVLLWKIIFFWKNN